MTCVSLFLIVTESLSHTDTLVIVTLVSQGYCDNTILLHFHSVSLSNYDAITMLFYHIIMILRPYCVIQSNHKTIIPLPCQLLKLSFAKLSNTDINILSQVLLLHDTTVIVTYYTVLLSNSYII